MAVKRPASLLVTERRRIRRTSEIPARGSVEILETFVSRNRLLLSRRRLTEEWGESFQLTRIVWRRGDEIVDVVVAVVVAVVVVVVDHLRAGRVKPGLHEPQATT